tara:strand:- start:969 stop:2039 length:1071 start_codon:yes stop_codon:yes gene_type:complete
LKILLFGEFSGLHNNLKDGLVELGHDVTIAAGSDGYKNIGNDISLESSLPGLLGQLDTRIRPFLNLPKLRSFDVVQIVNPFFPNAKYFPRQFFYSMLRHFNDKFFVLAAGSDAYYWRNGRKKLKYGPFDDFLKYDVKAPSFYMSRDDAFAYNKRIVENSDGLIPIMYEYELSYEGCEKRMNTIPLPVNTNKIEYRENVVQEKLVVFHGLSRYGFKGTRHVEEAFEILNKKYPNDVECIIDGQLPINEYLEVMSKTHVVIDQTNTYSLGMNGIYALAMGKVVLGGAEPEGLKCLGVQSSPVINITANKQSIVMEVEKLLANRTSIPQLGFDGRKFVEDVHCHVKVAQKYINTWNASV